MRNRAIVVVGAWVACGLVAGITDARGQEPPAEVAAVVKAGGKVDHEEGKADKPVVAVSFATTGASDEALDTVAPFAGTLKKLTLNNTKVTDAGLKKLKGLGELEKLYLVDTGVTDAGLDQLEGLAKLKVLSLVGTGVTDEGLEKLREMPALEFVFLAGTKVTEEGVKKLQEGKDKLKVER